MLNPIKIDQAVRLHRASYQLLQWLEEQFASGALSPERFHDQGTNRHRVSSWVKRNYAALPQACRPAPHETDEFSGLFSTFIQNTFQLTEAPGKRLYSPDAHCFCPMCSWMVDTPHMMPVRPGIENKKRAKKLMLNGLQSLLIHHNLVVEHEKLAALSRDIELRESLGLFAYGVDLLERTKGRKQGAASLVLWRSFAWTRHGSPKKGFRLTSEMIMDAEWRLLARLREMDREHFRV